MPGDSAHGGLNEKVWLLRCPDWLPGQSATGEGLPVRTEKPCPNSEATMPVSDSHVQYSTMAATGRTNAT